MSSKLILASDNNDIIWELLSNSHWYSGNLPKGYVFNTDQKACYSLRMHATQKLKELLVLLSA